MEGTANQQALMLDFCHFEDLFVSCDRWNLMTAGLDAGAGLEAGESMIWMQVLALEVSGG